MVAAPFTEVNNDHLLHLLPFAEGEIEALRHYKLRFFFKASHIAFYGSENTHVYTFQR